MHRCLCVDEIVRSITHELVTAERNATAVALARCCKQFEDPALDALWGAQSCFTNLLKTLPADVWGPGGYKSFERLPKTHEWARLRKYAEKMQEIHEFDALKSLSSQVLSVLQVHALREPLLPNVRTLSLWLTPKTEEFTPFIPLFLSTRTTTIHLIFSGRNHRNVTIASVITAFPTLCPNLHKIQLTRLPRDPTITAAVSELVLNTNQNNLRFFYVDSTLTEEACKVIYKHPGLCGLQTIIDRPIALPTMVLPNLTDIDIEYTHGHDWLQGFRGASLGKLTSVTITSETDPIGDFLGAFKSVALTTSIPATLSSFSFQTEHSWIPSYRSLLPFTQLTYLIIESSCQLGCSSTIDDDTIINLARAMPKLEELRLGGPPCETPGGVTVKGLAAVAYYCLHLRDLFVHFQVASLDPPEIPDLTFTDEFAIPRAACPMYYLQAGDTRVPEGSTLMVALTLLRIFPHLELVSSSDTGWEEVSRALYHSKQLACFKSDG